MASFHLSGMSFMTGRPLMITQLPSTSTTTTRKISVIECKKYEKPNMSIVRSSEKFKQEMADYKAALAAIDVKFGAIFDEIKIARSRLSEIEEKLIERSAKLDPIKNKGMLVHIKRQLRSNHSKQRKLDGKEKATNKNLAYERSRVVVPLKKTK